LAGQALDPNGPGGPDCVLARVLLQHALGHAAAAIGWQEDPGRLRAAIDALEQAGILATAGGDVARARSVLAAVLAPPQGEAQSVASRDDLVGAEVLLADVLRALRGKASIARWLRWSRRGLAVALVAALAAAMIPTLARGGPWEKYRWISSSAAYGFTTSGTLGTHGSLGLVFHTAYEDHPWVLVDLLTTRTIHSVRVVNRADCCDERCLPLVVEVAGDDGQFVEVGRRIATFSAWKTEFAPRRARAVRLLVEGRTFFHLQEVEIR
jgi:hypothetical protein